jgi:hypothetical protein
LRYWQIRNAVHIDGILPVFTKMRRLEARRNTAKMDGVTIRIAFYLRKMLK